MYSRISYEMVSDPLGSAEHTLGTVALNTVLGLNVPSVPHL